MAVAIMGGVFGLAVGIVGTSLYYSGRMLAANRRIKQLTREASRIEEPRF
jgi:hypothetical protein